MSEPRNKYVQFHASESEVLTLNKLSNCMGLSLSETLRYLIREGAALRLPDMGIIGSHETRPTMEGAQNAN